MHRRAVQIGDIFGRLMVEDLHSVSHDGKRRTYACRCECPEFKLVPVQSYDLTSGKVKSCGCLRKEIAVLNLRTSHAVPA